MSPDAAAAAPPAAPLRCQLTGPGQVVAGEPAVLHWVLRNAGSQPVDLLVWGTPFEQRWFAPYVSVQRNGVELAYGGASVKRGDPTPANYLRIDPAQSQAASIDLATAFDVLAPGRYRVQPRITLQDLLVGAPPGSARPRDQHRAVALDCNAVEFDVTSR